MFESTRMTFGEHLEELRKVLFKAVIALAIGCVFGFYFAEHMVKVLVEPLEQAMIEYDSETAIRDVIKRDGFVAPDALTIIEDDGYVPRRILIDRAEWARLLETDDSEFGKDIQAESYRFGADNFPKSKTAVLAKRLVNHESAGPDFKDQLAAVWKLMSPTHQAALKRIADQSEATDSDIATVVEVFDLVSDSSLNDDPAFQDLLTEPPFGLMSLLNANKPKPLASMKSILSDKSKLSESESTTLNRRLNRAIVAQMFPDQMPRIRKQLVELEFWEPLDFKPQSLAATDGFLIWLKTGLLGGTIIALPFVLYFIWSFVAAGLYPHEQKYVHMFLPISILLFIGGVCLAFFFVFQPVLGFLFSFNRNMGIAPEMRINDWLSFVMFLPLGFGVAFQLPLVMLFMNRINLFTIEAYLSKWRIAVMCIFVLAMFLTPADPISMLLMAIPLTFLYFLGIGMCKWMPKSENPFGEEAA
jgi:sec-independent protein translocase protein TatC